MRNDAPLVRHLTERFGIDCAREWQSVPYVIIPPEAQSDLIVFMEQSVRGYLPGMPRPKSTLDGDINLVWDDAVFELSSTPTTTVWIRVHKGVNLSWKWASLLPKMDVNHPDLCNMFTLECWVMADREVTEFPSLIFVPNESSDKERISKLYPTNLDKKTLNNIQAVIESWLIYMQQTPTYAVEVRNVKSHHPGTGNKKPWTRDDLPHIIMIDPARVNDYRSEPGESPKGTHASPRRHQRRGHWRRIRIDDPEQRKVFVKPCWVGATEWEYAGQTYRVKI